MATKAGVPIVPITITGAYETYPSSAILPLLPNGDNLKVHIHPMINGEGKTEAEIEEQLELEKCSSSDHNDSLNYPGTDVPASPSVRLGGTNYSSKLKSAIRTSFCTQSVLTPLVISCTLQWDLAA